MIKRKDYLVLIGFFIICLMFFYRNIFGGQSFFLRDITYLFHPWKTLTAELLQKGEMPLWNSYAFCGMPLLANWQSAVFYPFSLLFYIFKFTFALKAFHLIHLFLAGAFAYLFAKRNGFTFASAIVMMLVFSLNGYIVTRMEFLSHFSVDIWVFLTLLAVNNPLLLAGALGLSFLGGHQVFFMQLAVLFMFSLYSEKPLFAAMKSLGIGCAIFIAIIAVQLVPTIELAYLSGRAKAGIDFAIASIHSININDFLRLLSPLFTSSDKTILLGEKFSWTNTFTIGFSAALISLISFFNRQYRRYVYFALLIIAAGLFFALGSNNPAYSYIFEHISIFRMFRYPIQFMYFTVIGFAVLAAVGIQKFKYYPFIILLITAELLFVNGNFQILAPDEYFDIVPQTAKLLQTKAGNSRFILSPGTEKSRNIHSSGIIQGWESARNHLYSLTCMPYHLYNAYGYGEPLTTSGIEDIVNSAYVSDSAQAALPYYRKIGIEYLVCKNSLVNDQGYKLFKTDAPYIYKIPGNFGKYLPINKSITLVSDEPGRSVLFVQLTQPTSLVWKETFYPGWKAFYQGNNVAITPWEGVFRQISLPSGSAKVYQLYRPSSFMIGFLTSLLALCVILLIFINSVFRGKWISYEIE